MFLDNVLFYNGNRNQSSECSVEQNLVVEGIIQNFRFFKCLVFTTLLTSHINHQAFKFCYLLFFWFQWTVKIKKIPWSSYRTPFVGNNNIHRYVVDSSIKYQYGLLDTKILIVPSELIILRDFCEALNHSLFPRIRSLQS